MTYIRLTQYYHMTLEVQFFFAPDIVDRQVYTIVPPFHVSLCHLFTLTFLVAFFFINNSLQEFADQHKIPLIEVSAKNGSNVEQAFVGMVARRDKQC